ncbi:MAG: enhanced intracellular survival protein Eis, partial [Halobaculum sp.]
MVTFRPLQETDRRTLREILQYAFDPASGPTVDASSASDTGAEWPPELYEPYGLYADDGVDDSVSAADSDDGTVRELLAVCKHYSLEARVRSSWTTVGGLGAVAAPPEHRREGHVRELCRHTLESYRADGVPLVVLWPFSTSFYGRMGWGTAHDVCRVELPPEALPSHDTVGRFRRLDADDWQRLRGVEADDRTAATLALRRSEAWWRERTLADWAGGGVPYCYGYER